MEHRNAILFDKYDDVDHCGGERYTDEHITSIVVAACAEGHDIMVHAIGDKTIKKAIDAFEAARKAGHKSNRLCLTHAELLWPEQAARLAPLDITLQSTGLWMMLNPPLMAVLGMTRYNARYCFQGAIAAGTNFALGSDWPATVGGWKGTCPWSSMEAAITRRIPESLLPTLGAFGTPEQLAATFEPLSERLSVAQAVCAYTLGGAKQLGWDKWTGSLSVGKAADFVVCSQNVFAVEHSQIHKTEAVLTVCGGQVTHNALFTDGTLDAAALGSAQELAAAQAAASSCDSPHRRETSTGRCC